MARLVQQPPTDLLRALGVTEKYLTRATLTWRIGEPIELEITYFPTDETGNAMLDPGDSEQALMAAKKYKLVEIDE